MVDISLVIPCYNEQNRFKEGISHFLHFLESCKKSWEIILVNDGSTDNTLELLKEECKKNKNIKVISYSKNKGKGYAIKKGMLEANGLLIFFSDIDHSVPAKTITKFVNTFENGASVVVGSRRLKDSKLVKKQSFLRETLGRGFTLLVRILIDLNVADATCGFKAFRKDVAKKIFRNISIYDWAFDAEIIFICKKLKISYEQLPVEWSDAKGSKVNIIRDILPSLMGLVKIRTNGLLGKYQN